MREGKTKRRGKRFGRGREGSFDTEVWVSMRILHIGDFAGISTELSRAQRKLGHTSDTLTFVPSQYAYPTDFFLPVRARFPLRAIERMILFPSYMDNYDILHFHGGEDDAILPKGIDFALWRLLGKRVVIHHHGHDIRYKKENPFFTALANGIFVSTPDLLKYSPEAVWLPSPVPVAEMPYVGVKEKAASETVTILHAPTARSIKGTEFIVKAVEQLKKEGRRAELVVVENTRHDEAQKLFKTADIVVDQLIMGWYGMFAIECMSMGKPVCCYVSPDMERFLPSPMPVMNTSQTNITDALRELIDDFNMRAELGRRGRAYVEEIHDSPKVAEQSVKLYQ